MTKTKERQQEPVRWADVNPLARKEAERLVSENPDNTQIVIVSPTVVRITNRRK